MPLRSIRTTSEGHVFSALPHIVCNNKDFASKDTLHDSPLLPTLKHIRPKAYGNRLNSPDNTYNFSDNSPNFHSATSLLLPKSQGIKFVYRSNFPNGGNTNNKRADRRSKPLRSPNKWLSCCGCRRRRRQDREHK